MAWWHCTPSHFSAHPFRQVIHERSMLTTNPSPTGIPILHCTYCPSAFKTQPPASSNFFFSAREPGFYSFTYLYRSHFSVYDPAVRTNFKQSWFLKLSPTPHPFLSDFRIYDSFWRSANGFAQCGVFVTVQLKAGHSLYSIPFHLPQDSFFSTTRVEK
ncbi:hypothetical protein AVEN_126490-1 [Araneus ventricosus]|uniref:Uncharacterized protein n=1 Tax=Araneus ventricosus TaxID=182803 RepID=A0A4Y2WTL7_ARAVE|nr:hypothetical protein AVEN_126490-1 [Araneus ventricosus]